MVHPAINFGWLVKGEELGALSRGEFHERESPVPEQRPALIITYSSFRSRARSCFVFMMGVLLGFALSFGREGVFDRQGNLLRKVPGFGLNFANVL